MATVGSSALANRKTTDSRSYRSDIDGMRAVAVLSVILFHINETLVPGGFVGVDIFFVISGYLISLHIFGDLEKGRFSIIEFYRRRVKRIAPAMLTVVAVTLLLSHVLLRPEDSRNVAESSIWSLFSMANIYFWLYQDTSYFAAASNLMPLLHLWSLGVEEQFYIFWPLLLMAFYHANSSRKFYAVTLIAVVLSFAAGELLFDRDPSFVYYMLPTRAGELLVGAIVAQLILREGWRTFPEGAVSAIAYSGALLVGMSLFLLSEEDVFPGVRAILPTLGTAMLIWAGHYGDGWVHRLLKLKPMVWVGLISYSAYLWHWPLLAFYRYGQQEVGFTAGVVIFCATLVLSWLSYLYVERPARHSTRPALTIFINQYVMPASVLVAVSIAALMVDGYGLRWYSKDYIARRAEQIDRTRAAYEYEYVCQRNIVSMQDMADENCVVGTTAAISPKVILFGDSNAAHYVGVIGEFANHGKFQFRNLAISSCPPLRGDKSPFVKARRLADCDESISQVWGFVEAHDIIIISANWTAYQQRSDSFFDEFYKTVDALAARSRLVILLGKVPVIMAYDRLCREKSLSFPYMDCNVGKVPVTGDVFDVNEKLKQYAATLNNVEYFDLVKYLCPSGRCSAFDKSGLPLYYDSSHLALPASWAIGKQILEIDGLPFPFTLISAASKKAVSGSETTEDSRPDRSASNQPET